MSPVDQLLGRALGALPKKRISRALGWLASRRLAEAAMRGAIALYVRAYRVDLSDTAVPPGGFRTFDEFFTRPLRDGARPVHGGSDCLVVPADGLVVDSGRVGLELRLRIKGSDYTLRDLLGASDAERLAGGRFVVVYLAPRDYHRVHAAVGGEVRIVHHVAGTLFPVNAIGMALVPRLFAQNERVVVVQDSDRHGPVATVLVGAFGVGRIGLGFDPAFMTNVGRAPTTKHYPPGSAPRVERGAELGTFHVGSTVIVVTGPDVPLDVLVSPGERVRVGQVLATRAP